MVQKKRAWTEGDPASEIVRGICSEALTLAEPWLVSRVAPADRRHQTPGL
jgi:hypothetical protein